MSTKIDHRSDTATAFAVAPAATGFATSEAVSLGLALFEALAPFADPKVGVRRRFGLVLGPGLVQVKTQVTGNGPADLGRTPYTCAGCPLKEPAIAPVKRGKILAWSPKSRANMVKQMASIEWAPVVECGEGWRPAMVTLTLPRDWEAVCPTAERWTALCKAFRKRWDAAHGCGRNLDVCEADACRCHRLRGVWKKEFQRRGAPHLHINCAVGVGQDFRDWLSRTWTEVVYGVTLPASVLELPRDEASDRMADHWRAGTGIDWVEGSKASDPKRLAIYFAKRSATHNGAESKEYQHIVPEAWVATGGAGRFWGYWGLSKATGEVQLTEAQYVAMRRLMRRYVEAQKRTTVRTRRVRRPRVEYLGGCWVETDAAINEDGTVRRRRVTRRYSAPKSFTGDHLAGGAFALFNDAPAWFAQAVRWDGIANAPPRPEPRPKRL